MDRSLGSLLFAVLGLGVFFWWFERGRPSAREVAVVVALSAIAAASRVPFAGIPGVQPVTFLVILGGFVFGCRIGFLVGALAAFVSNLFLGQGPWTVWQMAAWGLCGGTAGVLGIALPRAGRAVLVPFAFLWGYLFGWIVNSWYWYAFVYPPSVRSWVAVNLSSFPFDTLHAVGNALFALLLGGEFLLVLRRFRRRLRAEYGKRDAGYPSPPRQVGATPWLAGCRMQDTGCGIGDAGCKIRAGGCGGSGPSAL